MEVGSKSDHILAYMILLWIDEQTAIQQIKNNIFTQIYPHNNYMDILQ